MSRPDTRMRLHERRECTILTPDHNVDRGREAAGRSAAMKQARPTPRAA